MNRPKFISGFAEEIDRYLDYKTASGYKESSFTFILRQFDRFCAGRGIRDVSFSKEDADAWSEKKETEASTSHYARVNKVKCFLKYLGLKGYDVYLMHDVFFRATDSSPIFIRMMKSSGISMPLTLILLSEAGWTQSSSRSCSGSCTAVAPELMRHSA